MRAGCEWCGFGTAGALLGADVSRGVGPGPAPRGSCRGCRSVSAVRGCSAGPARGRTLCAPRPPSCSASVSLVREGAQSLTRVLPDASCARGAPAGSYDDHDRWGVASGLGDIDDKEFSTGAGGFGVSFSRAHGPFPSLWCCVRERRSRRLMRKHASARPAHRLCCPGLLANLDAVCHGHSSPKVQALERPASGLEAVRWNGVARVCAKT